MLSARSDNNDSFIKLYDILANQDKKHIKADRELAEKIKEVTLHFDTNAFQMGEILGGGHWSLVFDVRAHDHQELGQKNVLKMFKPLPPFLIGQEFQKLQESVVAANQQFMNEYELNRIIYGDCWLHQFKLNERMVSLVVLPYLGDITLTRLEQDDYRMKRIPMQEWLRLFHILLVEMQEFHTKTNKIHNDIKPDNIVMSTRYVEETGLFEFVPANPRYRAANLIDFGNAAEKGKRSVFGDPAYSNKLESCAGLFFAFKDERTDIFALGKTLKELTEFIEPNLSNHLDIDMLHRCQKIFSRMMDNWFRRMPLNMAIAKMEECLADYAQVREEQHDTLEAKLEKFLEKLNGELARKSKNEETCCAPMKISAHNLWHKVHKRSELPLDIRISATEKMLLLVRDNAAPDFAPEEIVALNDGELGKVLSPFRLQSKLPTHYIRLERASFSARMNAGHPSVMSMLLS